MNPFFLLFREMLGAIRARTALYLTLVGVSILIFLAAMSFLLLSTTAADDATAYADSEVLVILSAQLSSSAIDDFYLEVRARSDVRSVTLRFAEDVLPGETGPRLLINAVSAEVLDRLSEELLAMDGVVRVEGPAAEFANLNGIPLPGALRIGLLAILALGLAGCLLSARYGFRALLRAFAREIRLLRLSGVSERTLVQPIVLLGVLLGFLAAFLLVLIGAVAHVITVAGAGFLGVVQWGAVAQTGVLVVVLGIVLGGLVGLLGAGTLGGREFRPFA